MPFLLFMRAKKLPRKPRIDGDSISTFTPATSESSAAFADYFTSVTSIYFVAKRLTIYILYAIYTFSEQANVVWQLDWCKCAIAVSSAFKNKRNIERYTNCRLFDWLICTMMFLFYYTCNKAVCMNYMYKNIICMWQT